MHVFDGDTLTQLLANHTCPSDAPQRRPAIRFALDQDRRVAGALSAERKLWEELDRLRIRILERHLRPFVAAMRKARAGKQLAFSEDHGIRIACANELLPPNPLRDYGLGRYVEEAKSSLVESAVIPENALAWLPDVALYFEWLNK
jgi:hypothetical protein